MRQEARLLSSAVPHSTAFLPPAFIAMLPPMQGGLGRGRVDREHVAAALGASATRCVTTPASLHTVATGSPTPGSETSPPAHRPSFSVLMTALFQASGTAPPV